MTEFFSSGREGTLSYNAADGRSIALGRVVVDPDSINGTLSANADLRSTISEMRRTLVHEPPAELAAAYERIDELTAVLRETADAIEDKFPDSIRAAFWRYFDAIDDALDERVST